MTTSDQPLASDGQYVTIAVASYLTGVPGRTLRRWIARGQIPTVANSGGRLVDIDAVRRMAVASGHMDQPLVTGGHSMVADGQGVATGWSVANSRPDTDHDPAIGDLATLIERQQQTIMELSGRCGFYQSEIQHLQAQLQAAEQEIRLLKAPDSPIGETPDVNHGSQAPESNTLDSTDVQHFGHSADPAPTSTAHRSAPEQNGPVRGAECPPRRPWWAFWRWV